MIYLFIYKWYIKSFTFQRVNVCYVFDVSHNHVYIKYKLINVSTYSPISIYPVGVRVAYTIFTIHYFHFLGVVTISLYFLLSCAICFASTMTSIPKYLSHCTIPRFSWPSFSSHLDDSGLPTALTCLVGFIRHICE